MPFRFTALSLALLLPLLAGCGGGGNKGSSSTTPTTPTPPITPVVDTTHDLFYDASPGSTLLPAGATTLAFTLSTNQNASLRYSVGSDAGWTTMTPFDGGQGTRAHTVTFKGLNPDTTVVNEVYVRCDAVSDQVLHLRYRVLPRADPTFPRKGNLWGWGMVFPNGGLDHCKRIDLWLGASPTEAQVKQLRALNPDVMILDSINTVEHNDGEKLNIPDNYWLKDTAGKRIEVWPGAYRLNITKPEVAAFQAQFAYQRLLDKNLCLDGVFFDNFFTSESWLKTDVWGDPIQIDANEDGQPDDPAVLDAAWKAGVYAELQAWRKLMPYAYASGHLMDSTQPAVQAIFNGNSIGFLAPASKDGTRSFLELFANYNSWWTNGRPAPILTMIESGPPYQIAYGYGFSPKGAIPAPALEFARTFYPYMRWGLGVTLMNDGYFANELGDAWHGQDWWYDELDFNLGYPLGAFQRLDLGTVPTTDFIQNGGFEQSLSAWTGWVNTAAGNAGMFARDTTQAASGTASYRVNITNAGPGKDWYIAFLQTNIPTVKGIAYDLSFKVRSDAPHDFSVGLQKGSADWHSYGLSRSLTSTGPTWQSITLSFEATDTASDGRLGFNVSSTIGTVWIDDVKMVLHPADIFRRDFDNGTVILNATNSTQTIPVTGSYRRLTGTQAPRYQYIVDDADAGFTAGTWSSATYDSGLNVALGPWFHDWGAGCHQSSSTTDTATWNLGIRAGDTYTLDAWWPAAPDAVNWSSAVRYEVTVNGSVIASATLDQTKNGDQWNRIASVALTKSAGAQVRITNLQSKPAIADAILVQSTARYNDGSDATSVELDAKDAIILLKK